MMCTTVIHGGVCHRTPTPHKSGNKMKDKKKFFFVQDDEWIETNTNSLVYHMCMFKNKNCIH